MEHSAKESAYWALGLLFLWLAYYLHGPWSRQWAEGFSSLWNS